MRQHQVNIAVDGRSNLLIVTASSDRLAQIENVIQVMDVPQTDQAEVPQMIYRIYMLEQPSEHLGLRPFMITATGSAPLPPASVLNAGSGSQMQIESFRQVPTMGKGLWQFSIAGRAASNEALANLTEKIPDCQISDLAWEEETPIMPTTRVAPLPESLQAHVDKFLGEGTGIVGYWFGNLSIPGAARAPIGPWVFDMTVDPTAQEGEAELEITVLHESYDESAVGWQILSNSIRGKINRPVIIGYNRDNRGVQTMGALVIVPEPALE
jgi:hypothetical protein